METRVYAFLLMLGLILGLFLEVSAKFDPADEDVLGVHAARCRAKCAEKFLSKPVNQSADQACLYGRGCYDCLEMCTSLTSNYYQWLYLCSVTKYCKKGCKTACKFVTRMKRKEKDIPDRRSAWTWERPTTTQHGRVLEVSWSAPSLGTADQTPERYPVYNLLWRDLGESGTIPKHYQWSMDREVRLPLTKVTSHFELTIQAFLKDSLIGETKLALSFTQSDAPVDTPVKKKETSKPYRVEEDGDSPVIYTILKPHETRSIKRENRQQTTPPPVTTKPSEQGRNLNQTGAADDDNVVVKYQYSDTATVIGIGLGMCCLVLLLGGAVAGFLLYWRRTCKRSGLMARGDSECALLASRSSLAFAGIDLTENRDYVIPERKRVYSLRCHHGHGRQLDKQSCRSEKSCCHEEYETAHWPGTSRDKCSGGRLVACSLRSSLGVSEFPLTTDLKGKDCFNPRLENV